MIKQDNMLVSDLLDALYQPGMTYDEYLRKIYLHTKSSVLENRYKSTGAEMFYQGLQETLFRMNDPEYPYDKEYVRKQQLANRPGFPSDAKEIQKLREGKLDYIGKAVYDFRRVASYPVSTESSLDELNNYINDQSVMYNNTKTNGWLYRLPKGYQKEEIVERIYINARGAAEVAKFLDDFCCKNNCYYKMPRDKDFSKRVDTYIIYSSKPFSDKDKENIIRMVSPYVRKDLPKRTNDLDGEKLADGIFIAPNYSGEHIERHIASLDSPLEVSLRGTEESAAAVKPLQLSTGTVKVFEFLTEAVKKHFPKETAEIQRLRDKAFERFDVLLENCEYVLTAKNGVLGQKDLDLLQKMGCVSPKIAKGRQGEIKSITLSNSGSNRGFCNMLIKQKTYPRPVKDQNIDFQQALSDVVATNDVYQNPETGLVGFVPKKGVSKMQAYETLSKLKVFGLLLALSVEQKDGSRLFVADPKAKDSKNAAIIDGLKRQLGKGCK